MLLLFRFGSIPSHDSSLPVSFRAEARKVALARSPFDYGLRPTLGASGPDETARSLPAVEPPLADSATSSALDLPLGAGPVLGPLRPAYHPREWVSGVAHSLNVADHPLARAAIWLSGIPVELDARPPSRVYVRFTLKGF
jgi:hypothetical protein